MTRLVLGAAAQRDVASVKKWYTEQTVSDIALDFQRELEEVLQKVERFPSGFPVVHRDIRKANLRRFPYSVFYQPRSDHQLYVLAVLHHARHPRVWQKRR